MATSSRINSIVNTLEETLPNRVGPKRLKHIYRVAATLAILAQRFEIDPGRAQLAALSHDYDRNLPPHEAYAYISEHNLSLLPVEWRNYKMVHGAITADRLQRDFGCTDMDVIHAVRYHTIGHADFGPLGKALFIADSCEPGRKAPTKGEREEILSQPTLDTMLIALLSFNRRRFGHLEEPSAELYARLQGEG